MYEIVPKIVDLDDIATKLSTASMDKKDGIYEPFTRIEYQEVLDKNMFQFPEELMSIYYHPIYKELTYEQKWNLSLKETVNFFSINIHGERQLVKGLEERLYIQSRIGESWKVGDYLQHFIHEENAHTHMLAGYCFRYGDGVMKDYTTSVQDPILCSISQELLFFGRVFVFESFLDYLNSIAMRDTSIDTTARQIHRLHHIEEARHIAFDRAVIRYCVNVLKNQKLYDELKIIAKLLDDYASVAVKSLYSPKIYKNINIENPTSLPHETQEVPERIKIEKKWMFKAKEFLTEVGLGKTDEVSII
jgi:hypothetical protein